MVDRSWTEYVERFYRADLEAFSASMGLGRTRLQTCTCNPGHFREHLQRSIPKDRQKAFVVVLFLECLLQAGVHSYDKSNFREYVARRGHDLYIESHGTQGMYHPQFVLLGIERWTAKDVRSLEQAFETLVPLWQRAYDSLFGAGSSLQILSGLAADPDLRFDLWGSLQPALVGRYIKWIGAAATR